MTARAKDGRRAGGIESLEGGFQVPINKKASSRETPQMRNWRAAPEIGVVVSFGQHHRCLEKVLFWVKSCFGKSFIYRDARFPFVSDHHTEDASPFEFGQSSQVSVERQLKLSTAHTLRQIARQVVPFVFVCINLQSDTDAELKSLPRRWKEAILDRF